MIAGDYKIRDVKAVIPFIDVETLKASKNQDSTDPNEKKALANEAVRGLFRK